MPWDIAKWDPMKDMASLRDQVDRLFQDFFGRFPTDKTVADKHWFPTLDLEETSSDVIVTAEIPGMKKDEIHIAITGDQLSISGERMREKEEEDRTYHRIERSYGKFQRSVTLPTDVKVDKAKATYKEGVLTVTLPKAEKAKGKEISIEVK